MAIWLPSAVHPCITRISPAGDIARRDSLRRPLRTRRRKSPVDRMAPGASRPSFTIESEEVVYARYMTMYNRRVVFPSRDGACGDPGAGREVHDFDVVGHPGANFHFVVAFPFHPPDDPSAHWSAGHVTLIREYAQGPNALIYGLPAGSYHQDTHKNLEGAARAELSEEAHLAGGEVHRLLDCPDGIAEVKWCRNRFTPFIVIGPEKDEKPGQRDQEEFIEVERVSIGDLKSLLRSGDMMLPSVTTAYWAFEWLEEHYGKPK